MLLGFQRKGERTIPSLSEKEYQDISHQRLKARAGLAPGGIRDGGGPETVRVRLLGGFRVSVESRTIEDDWWRLRKARGVVKLLALAEGHRLHREQIAAALWPDLGARRASNNLHRALHFARAALGDAQTKAASPRLSLRHGLIELCPGWPLWVDVEAFEEAATNARRSREPAAYRTAIELYAGDLLPEDRYEPWTEEKREELRRLRRELLVELAAIHEEQGEYTLAIEALRSAVAQEATDEESHASLMRLHALAGRRHGALHQYERLRTALREELDKEPDEATRRLYEEIRAGAFPAAPSPPLQEPSRSTPNNLTAPLTSFVGRGTEMVEFKRDLSMTRLLTLTGAGGSGKTRLALEVARGLVGIYPDGVWFVELAPLPDPELVQGAVAQALGVREQPGQPLIRALSAHLGSRQTLLILDNCEHVVEAAAGLVNDLLESCPKLRVLATSREPLGVPGETVRPVPPLAVPAEEGVPTVESVMLREAARLFVERARSRLPDFEVTTENAGSVARVCRKLDGIPLAIELAAARMGALAVEQVAQRLEGSLGLLTGGGRTVESRHRTLRATLDWSHDLLDEAERALFRRLSVFTGGWTLEAAEAVGSGGGIEGEDALDLLSRLVDKSLVVAGASGTGAARYRMLEPVRQYCHERLEESSETERVRERHARYFLEFAEGDATEAAERQVINARPVAWVRRMEGEHANLGAALNWSLGNDAGASAAEVGLRLAVALFWFWHAHHSEGRRYLERAARRLGDPATARWRARASHGASWLALFQGDPGTAKVLVEEAVALYREAQDEEGIAFGLVQLGMVAVLGGRDDIPLRAVLEELGERKPEIKNRATLGYLLMLEGLVALGQGDFELSAALHEESLGLLREIGDTQGEISALINLGGIALARGDHEGAEPVIREALLLGRETDMKSAVQLCLFGMACVAAVRERPVRAARLWGAVEGIRDTYNLHPTPITYTLTGYETRLAATREAVGEETFATAWEEGRTMPPEQAIEYALSAEIPPAAELPPPGSLTRRQREVAALIRQGLSNRHIAQRIGVTERTVEAHVGNVLKRLGLSSRTQIAAWAVNQGSKPWRPGDPDRRAGN